MAEKPGTHLGGRSGFGGFGLLSTLILFSFLGSVLAIFLRAALETLLPDPLATVAERERAAQLVTPLLEASQKERDQLRTWTREMDLARATAEATLWSQAPEKIVAMGRESPTVEVFWVDRLGDRLRIGAETATLSAALPALKAALDVAPQGRSFKIEGAVFAVGPFAPDGWSRVAKAPLFVPSSEDPSLDQLSSALVSLASPLPVPPKFFGVPAVVIELLVPLFGLLFGALLAVFWGHRRFVAPLTKGILTVDAHLSGERSARADEALGGREARALATIFNRLIDDGEKKRNEGRHGRAASILALSSAIEALGNGDLAQPAAPTDPELLPLALSLVEAQQLLASRIAFVYQAGVDATAAGEAIACGARKMARGIREQLEALKKLCAELDGAFVTVAAAAEGLPRALLELKTVVQDQRKGAQELRAEVALASRRAKNLNECAELASQVLERSEAIGESLDLLSALGRSGAASAPRSADSGQLLISRAAHSSRRGIESLEAIRREVVQLKADLVGVARMLEASTAATPVIRLDLAAGVMKALVDTGTAFARTTERASEGLRSVERAANLVQGGAEQLLAAAGENRGATPRLHLALAEFELGEAFDRDLLAGLDRARQEYEQAGPHGLSAASKATVEELAVAAEAARSKLARLVTSSENVLAVLRDVRPA